MSDIKSRKDKNNYNNNSSMLTKSIMNPLWLTISEAAKLGGVNNRTIRRAIQSKTIKYKIIGRRYYINLTSVITYLYSKAKLKNKLNQFGIGQYITKWRQ